MVWMLLVLQEFVCVKTNSVILMRQKPKCEKRDDT